MAKDDKGKTKIGAGHLEAFWRQGIAELRNAAFPDSNVVQKHVEPGLYGTAVSAEIDRQRQEDKVASPDSKDVQREKEKLPEKEYDREYEPG